MKTRVAAFLVTAFVLRLAFGLCSEFWYEDELQIYLIGLKFYTTGAWPYFGPDVVYTQTQIPGALQGLLVGGPLWLVALPEAPYLLLNLLSTVSLGLLAWYIQRRVPDVPSWFLWSWVFFCPWTLNFSTHIVNPSYVLTGAIVFFVGALELIPSVRARLVPEPLAFGSMGFGLLWVYQLTLSFPLLLPFVMLVFATAARGGWRRLAFGAAWFAFGAAIAGSTLAPTLLEYGPGASAGEFAANVQFEPSNLLQFPHVVARFLSFASFELPRFIGRNTEARLHFLSEFPWAAPFAVFAGLCGIVQPFLLLIGFLRREGAPGWVAVKRLTLAALLLICASFLFSVKDPASHTFYVTLPLAMIYAFYCWAPLFRSHAVRVAAAALLVAGLITHVAIAIDRVHDRSLYANRALVLRAIQERNYTLLGERRPLMWRAGFGSAVALPR